MGKLAEYLLKKWGFHTSPNVNPETDTIGTSATKLLGNNPDRVMWVIFNLGATVGYCFHDETVDTTKGYYLDKTGGVLSMIADEDGELVGWPVFGKASVATKVLVVEVVGQ